MNVVGITGLSRSGKDTIADVIVEEYGFKKVSFADPLKRAAAVAFNIPLDRMYHGNRDEIIAPWGISIRVILQKFGTECMREVFTQDFWIIRLMKELETLSERGVRGVVISDVRFDNEAQMIKDCGGVIYEVTRPGLVRLNHASEAGLSARYINKYIENDGTLDQLYDKARRATQIFEILD